MDNLTKKDQGDRSKINMHEVWEDEYWTKHFGISKGELQKAIERVGNSAAAIRKELGIVDKADGKKCPVCRGIGRLCENQ